MKAQRLRHIGPMNTHELQLISDAVKDSSNIIAITGAGISLSAGIPSAKNCKPAPTHLFIRNLCFRGQLIRTYAQNIDGKEDELHGSLRFLRCMYCNIRTSWDVHNLESATLLGEQPVCLKCERVSRDRMARNKRRSNPGALRLDITLYDEVHLQVNEITDLKIHDLTRENPEILLIFGTRLLIKGVKNMVKEFAQSIHGRGGLVVFVNLTAPNARVWGGIIDFWVKWDCDSWVKDLKNRNMEWSSSLTEGAEAARNNTP
ncbi:DHS-like NAD/FAD-binding domain-containing protein [Triangularia verruculosa]|uniref:DHS-like NAD/FAD-binding domain-containing protein n=1 Tax=Triangularia verruculosa TaxID=2587418 RepID=A0AAN6X610_9PEZI|nr:DHS-like NAD/FAD-binding domain-containing protein [Triangularia verruculosa]